MKKTIIALVLLVVTASCVSHDITPNPTVQFEPAAESLLGLARADLAQRLGVAAADISVVSVTARDFSDTSLGVPQPGQVYAQVITPGYVLVLAVHGQEYTYHGSGARIVLATVPTSTLPIALSSNRRSQ
jgi:hypothetical protein